MPELPNGIIEGRSNDVFTEIPPSDLQVPNKMFLTEYAQKCYAIAYEHGFWNCFDGVPEDIKIATKLVLIHSEISEALEAIRKRDHENFDEEIADTFIRLFDLAHFVGIDLDKVIQKKMEINTKRPILHGKSF